MPRRATGSVHFSRGRWYAQITLGAGPVKRPTIALPTCSTEEEARARLEELAGLAAKLRNAGLVELAPDLLERAAAAKGERALAVVRRGVELLIERGVRSTEAPSSSVTFKAFADRWISGSLSREFPDHVKAKRSAERDRQNLERHVLPIVGDVPLDAFTIDHGLAVLQSLPADLEASTRRQIAKCMARVLSLAHWPARLITANPIPRGFSPQAGPEKALQWVYPDEDARLLACPAVPLLRRIYYGFQAREGMRPSEGRLLAWGDLDLERGTVRLDQNKTDSPRMWALNAGVVRALRAWRQMRERELGRPVEAGDIVFVNESGEPMDRPNLARVFRDHLKAAGITRAGLFDKSPARRVVRVHDLRATAITLWLAHGKTEAWVADRTGHASSREIQRYRRAARTAAELGMPELRPLDVAIPELAALAGGNNAGGNAGSAGDGVRSANEVGTELCDT